ncbi:hypothetical protein ES702_02767 [subsurface metagenome]
MADNDSSENGGEDTGRERSPTDAEKKLPTRDRPPETLTAGEKESLKQVIAAEARSGSRTSLTSTEKSILKKDTSLQKEREKAIEGRIRDSGGGMVEVSIRQFRSGREIKTEKFAGGTIVTTTMRKKTKNGKISKSSKVALKPSRQKIPEKITITDTLTKKKTPTRDISLTSLARQKLLKKAVEEAKKTSFEFTDVPSVEPKSIRLSKKKKIESLLDIISPKSKASGVIGKGDIKEFKIQRKEFLATKLDVLPAGEFKLTREAPPIEALRKASEDDDFLGQIGVVAGSLAVKTGKKAPIIAGIGALGVLSGGLAVPASVEFALGIGTGSAFLISEGKKIQKDISLFREGTIRGKKTFKTIEFSAELGTLAAAPAAFSLGRAGAVKFKEFKFDIKLGKLEKGLIQKGLIFEKPIIKSTRPKEFEVVFEFSETGVKPVLERVDTPKEFQATFDKDLVLDLDLIPTKKKLTFFPSKSTIKSKTNVFDIIPDIPKAGKPAKKLKTDFGEEPFFEIIPEQTKFQREIVIGKKSVTDILKLKRGKKDAFKFLESTETFELSPSKKKLFPSKKGEFSLSLEVQKGRKPQVLEEFGKAPSVKTKVTKEFSLDKSFIFLPSLSKITGMKQDKKSIGILSSKQLTKLDIGKEIFQDLTKPATKTKVSSEEKAFFASLPQTKNLLKSTFKGSQDFFRSEAGKPARPLPSAPKLPKFGISLPDFDLGKGIQGKKKRRVSGIERELGLTPSATAIVLNLKGKTPLFAAKSGVGVRFL